GETRGVGGEGAKARIFAVFAHPELVGLVRGGRVQVCGDEEDFLVGRAPNEAADCVLLVAGGVDVGDDALRREHGEEQVVVGLGVLALFEAGLFGIGEALGNRADLDFFGEGAGYLSLQVGVLVLEVVYLSAYRDHARERHDRDGDGGDAANGGRELDRAANDISHATWAARILWGCGNDARLREDARLQRGRGAVKWRGEGQCGGGRFRFADGRVAHFAGSDVRGEGLRFGRLEGTKRVRVRVILVEVATGHGVGHAVTPAPLARGATFACRGACVF